MGPAKMPNPRGSTSAPEQRQCAVPYMRHMRPEGAGGRGRGDDPHAARIGEDRAPRRDHAHAAHRGPQDPGAVRRGGAVRLVGIRPPVAGPASHHRQQVGAGQGVGFRVIGCRGRRPGAEAAVQAVEEFRRRTGRWLPDRGRCSDRETHRDGHEDLPGSSRRRYCSARTRGPCGSLSAPPPAWRTARRCRRHRPSTARGPPGRGWRSSARSPPARSRAAGLGAGPPRFPPDGLPVRRRCGPIATCRRGRCRRARWWRIRWRRAAWRRRAVRRARRRTPALRPGALLPASFCVGRVSAARGEALCRDRRARRSAHGTALVRPGTARVPHRRLLRHACRRQSRCSGHRERANRRVGDRCRCLLGQAVAAAPDVLHQARQPNRGQLLA